MCQAKDTKIILVLLEERNISNLGNGLGIATIRQEVAVEASEAEQKADEDFPPAFRCR